MAIATAKKVKTEVVEVNGVRIRVNISTREVMQAKDMRRVALWARQQQHGFYIHETMQATKHDDDDADRNAICYDE